MLQRVFYEVWRSRDRYDPTRSLEAWALGIARKRAIDQLRRRHANVVPIEELRDIAGDDGRELAERYARANEVRGALERLPREQREVLTLAYFGDLTQTEIAERLGVPLGTEGTDLPRPPPPGRHHRHGGLSGERGPPGRAARAAPGRAAAGHRGRRRPAPGRLRPVPPRPGRGGRGRLGPAGRLPPARCRGLRSPAAGVARRPPDHILPPGRGAPNSPCSASVLRDRRRRSRWLLGAAAVLVALLLGVGG